MTAIVILNIALVAFVVIGMLALLSWGIRTDKGRTVPVGKIARRQSRGYARVGRPVPTTSRPVPTTSRAVPTTN